MKKTIIFSLLVGASILFGVSCMEIDNFDAPESRFSGNIIDSTTGQPILASQGHGRIRMWEVSFSENPTHQDIPLKQDGSFNNQRLFPGTYDVTPQGPWWPTDTVQVGIGSSATHDFEVVPYLTLSEFETRLVGTTLYMSCRLFSPPSPTGEVLPLVLDIRPFVSRTQWCGPGAAGQMSYYDKATYRTLINKTWQNIEKEDDGKSIRYELPPLDLKAGYSYHVRMGAKVRDAWENFNLTEIVEITVPN